MKNKFTTSQPKTEEKRSSRNKTFYIYTDGSCLQGGNTANPGTGCGGWAVVIIDPSPGKSVCFGGGEIKTTNARMEITAVCRALQRITADDQRSINVNVWSDSEYVVGGIKNLLRWKERNWVTQGNTPLKNADLWQLMEKIISEYQISIYPHWVKGHNGHPFNELADQIAQFHSKLTASNLTKSHMDTLTKDIEAAKDRKSIDKKWADKVKANKAVKSKKPIAFEPIPDKRTKRVW